MFCKYCGTQQSNDAIFCTNCGKRIKVENKEQKELYDKSEGKELDRQALIIYLKDVLALECCRSRLKKNLETTLHAVSYLRNWNYYQRYEASRRNYPDGGYSCDYVHLFYNGDASYIAMEKEYNSIRVYTYDSMPNKYCKWVAITNKNIPTVAKWSSLWPRSSKRECTLGLINALEDFNANSASMFQAGKSKIKELDTSLNEITFELDKTNKLIECSYRINIIPTQFRNIYAVYFLYDFMRTSRESFSTALLHFDLNEIKSKLDKIIEQQEEIIIQLAVLESQNRAQLEQNKLTLEKLSAIENNTDQAAQYAKIASANAEACAWICQANYIDKLITK